jgi:hypothetical protein
MVKKGPQNPLIFGAGVQLIHSWPAPTPTMLDLSPDGACLVFEQNDALLCRESRTGQELWKTTIKGGANALRYSPDGTRLAASSSQGYVTMLDAKTGRLLGEHLADRPRGGLCWSPDSSRVLSTHGHHKTQIALLDRNGKKLSLLEMPQELSSVAFINDEQVVITRFQADILLVELSTGKISEKFERPGFEIGVAASHDYIALTRDHGHLLLCKARPEASLPNAKALKTANQPTFDERMARTELRLKKKVRSGYSLEWEKSQAEKVWKNGSPAKGWELWLPLPHCQIQNMRFVSPDSPLLLLCDGRDASLLSVGAVVHEQLLIGLFPIPGEQGYLVDIAYQAGLAAVSIRSSNMRLSSQVLVLEVADGS